jgi:hypothetical protein
LLEEGARHRRRLPVTALVVLVAIPVAIVGVFSTWTTDGPVTLNGTEGPHDGWLIVIMAALALAWTRSMARGSWVGVAGVLGASIVMLWTAVEDWRESRAVFDTSASYGLLLVVAASVALAGAAVARAAELIRVRRTRHLIRS